MSKKIVITQMPYGEDTLQISALWEENRVLDLYLQSVKHVPCLEIFILVGRAGGA